jgi:predicted Zn finger-like uncharacterized protein
MQIACPDCGAKYKVSDEHAGKSVKCKQCGAQFTAEPMADAGGYELDALAASAASGAPPRSAPPRSPSAAARPAYGAPPIAPSYGYTGPAATSKLAVWALILGVIGLVPVIGILPGLIGVVLGIVALSKIGAADNRLKGGGMAVTGVVTGGVGLLISVIFVLLLAIMLPALGVARTTARKMTNSTQQRGIHQGMVTFAQGNKTPTGDGFYPGLDRNGNTLTDPLTGVYTANPDGRDPAYRYALMLGMYFTPDYMISPMDGGTKTPAWGGQLTSANYSYAMLDISESARGRRGEWKETINSSAVVLSDRNTGSPNAPSSIWSGTPGEWEGTVTMNDGSATWLTYFDMTTGLPAPIVQNTRYADGPINTTDDLFKDETNGDDALMITGP